MPFAGGPEEARAGGRRRGRPGTRRAGRSRRSGRRLRPGAVETRRRANRRSLRQMYAMYPVFRLSLHFLLLQQQLQALSDHVCITASEPSVNHLVANAGAWSISFFDEITNITAFTKMMVSQSSALLMHRSKIYKMRCE